MSHRAVCSRCQGTGVRIGTDGGQNDCWTCMGAIFIDDCFEVFCDTQSRNKDYVSPTQSQYALNKAIETILRDNTLRNIKQGHKNNAK